MSKSSLDQIDPSDLIRIFFEDLDDIPSIPDTLSKWLVHCADRETLTIDSINIIFCSDNYLSEFNSKYLNKEDLTDVIAFQFNTNPIEGEIYISWDRVQDNAPFYSENNLFKELVRVVLHGFLHLCGYSDKNKATKVLMRSKEDLYLEEYLRSQF
jgi:probable rRNA maturation factor